MPIVGVTPSTARAITLGPLSFMNDPTPGLQWRGLKLTGWDGSPGSSGQSQQKLLAPGAWPSSNPQLASRGLALTGTIVASSPDVMIAACDRLDAAASVVGTLLQVDDGGATGVRSAKVRRLGEVLVDPQPTRLVKPFSIGLEATDPRKFGAAITLTTALPSSTGGLSVPFTVPFTIAAVNVSGQVSATNPAPSGKPDGPVVVRFTGPVPSPMVAHTNPDGSIDVFAMNLTLGAGEWVDINMEAKTALAQGQQVSRSQWITSRGWSGFKPGVNSWAFSCAGAYNPSALMTVTATPAW